MDGASSRTEGGRGPVTKSALRDRIYGIDVARGVAIIGMMAVHILEPGPVPDLPQVPEDWHTIFEGRSRVLFAVVAGVSLALMSGREHPLSGIPLIQARLRIVIRALLIFVVGGLLMATDTIVGVILEYYAVLFVLVLPFLRWTSSRLFSLATVLAVIMPPLFVIGMNLYYLGDLGNPTTLTRLILSGQYPAVIFVVYILTGLGIGRLALHSRRTQWWLLGAGSALAVAGAIGGQVVKRITGPPPYDLTMPANAFEMGRMATMGQRSGNWFEVIGPTGVAVAIIGAALLAMPRLRVFLMPLEASGRMALTIYVVHVISLIWIRPTIENQHQIYVGSVLVAFLVALIWQNLRLQGPVEWLIATVSKRSALIL
jgi:uncharacterized membrane protein YeiB